MPEFIKADVFFFITTIAVVLVTAGVVIALYYAIKILRNVRDVSDRASAGSEALQEDFSELRMKVKENGFSLRLFRDFLRKARRLLSGAGRSKKKHQ